jgi:hypothetical protein
VRKWGELNMKDVFNVARWRRVGKEVDKIK